MGILVLSAELAGPDVKGRLGGSLLFYFSTKILSQTSRLCLPSRLPSKNSRPGKDREGEPCGPAWLQLCLPVVGAPPVSRLEAHPSAWLPGGWPASEHRRLALRLTVL